MAPLEQIVYSLRQVANKKRLSSRLVTEEQRSLGDQAPVVGQPGCCNLSALLQQATGYRSLQVWTVANGCQPGTGLISHRGNEIADIPVRSPGGAILEAGDAEVLRRVSGRRFPESRRKAYYLSMSIHEHLPPQARKDLKEVGWTKGLELAKVARRDGQEFDCATWLHKARSLPKDQFKQEVERELTGRESEPWEIIYFKLAGD